MSKLTGIVAAIAAIGGGIFALWSFEQEREKRLDDKKKATLQFVQSFNSDEFLGVRTKALKFLDAGIGCDQSVGSGPDRLNIFTYVDFFDTVLICVNEGVCDKRTAFEFFERYANYHWPGFKQHIEFHRKYEEKFGVRTEYGAGLEKMARAPTDAFLNCRKNR